MEGSGADQMEQHTSGNKLAEVYRRCIALEQKLREELKHKNFYEPSVRAVRAELRSAYEQLLFLDYVGAQVNRLLRFSSLCRLNQSLDADRACLLRRGK